MQTIWDFYTGMGECSASGRYLPRVGHHLQAVTCLISTTQSEIINPRDRAHSVAGAWSNNLRFSDRQFVLYAAVRGEASLVVRR